MQPCATHYWTDHPVSPPRTCNCHTHCSESLTSAYRQLPNALSHVTHCAYIYIRKDTLPITFGRGCDKPRSAYCLSRMHRESFSKMALSKTAVLAQNYSSTSCMCLVPFIITLLRFQDHHDIECDRKNDNTMVQRRLA